MSECCNIVKEPRGESKLKVLARRAPSQEEYFSKGLKTNPISVKDIKVRGGGATAASDPAAADGDEESSDEPTMMDLRSHIAAGLDMADSSELFELLVGGKIVDAKLKIRVVGCL